MAGVGSMIVFVGIFCKTPPNLKVSKNTLAPKSTCIPGLGGRPQSGLTKQQDFGSGILQTIMEVGWHGMACCLAMEMFLYQGGGYPLRFLGDGIALHAFESFGLVCAIDSNYY